MNVLSNLARQQIDETGLYSPMGDLRPDVTQADIDDGLRRARVLRATAFHRAAATLSRVLCRPFSRP